MVEANFAAVAGQLNADTGGAGRLQLIDGREILSATARLVGARLGDTEIDTSIAVTQHYVEQGMPGDFKVSATKKSLARLLYNGRLGGTNTEQIHKALVALWRMELNFHGYNAATGTTQTIYARLFTRLRFDDQITFRRDDPARYDPAVMGASGEGTVEITLDEWLASQVRAGYWVAVDWERLRALSGHAKTLWLLLNTPSAPFLVVPDAPSRERLVVPLDESAYRALGIHRKQARDRRRALRLAGQRIMRADPTYVNFDVIEDLVRPSEECLTIDRQRRTITQGVAAHLAQMRLSV